MTKSLLEEMGGRYERQGDYFIPCLTLPAEEEQPIERHLCYLKEYRRGTYIILFTGGRLNAYLAAINRRGNALKAHRGHETEGITKQLKAENQLEWVQRFNNIRVCAREIVEGEIVYA